MFGGQTVGFVTITQTGQPGYLGVKDEARTVETVSGCHFRPLSAQETPDGATNVAGAVWKCTAPPEASVLAGKSTGVLLHDGTPTPADVKPNRFQIDGPIMPKYDLDGTIHHVTILCTRQAG